MKTTIPKTASALAKRDKKPRREDTSRPAQTIAAIGHNRGPPIAQDQPIVRDPPIARDALTLDEFCKANGVSRPMLYKLWRQGLGPKFMLVGFRRIISTEAGAAWRKQLERQSSSAKALPEIERRSKRGSALARSGQTKGERVAP
jgi:hypothetical protein